MARYERDYGREMGRQWQQGQRPIGGMRSDAWGGTDWRSFPGQEGWFGAGYEGMNDFGPEGGFRGEERQGRGGWFANPFTRRGGEFQGGYGEDFGNRYQNQGYGRNRDFGRGGREFGYGEGWEDSWSTSYDRSGGGRGGERATTRASEIMTENPQSVTPDVPLSEVAQKMRDLDVGIIPVVDNAESRRLRGVITDRDIAIRAIAEGKDGSAKVADCMTQHVRSVNKNDSIHDVMRVMRQDQVRRVPVTDREGRLVGIIAQADLAVDYGAEDPGREREVGETLERISEPAQPERSRMAASGRRESGEQTAKNRGGSRNRSRGGANRDETER